MPRDERYPTPLLNMNPSGLAGFGAIVVMSIGISTLFGNSFVVGLGLMIVISVGSAFVVRKWRANHPVDESVLHLEPPLGGGAGKDV
jgi:hypothetical protein